MSNIKPSTGIVYRILHPFCRLFSLLQEAQVCSIIHHERNEKLKKNLKEIPEGYKLTKEQLDLCKTVWGKLKVYDKWIAYYNFFHDTFDPRMLPDNVFLNYIDRYFNDWNIAQAIDDKNLYDKLFCDIKQPETIFRKQNGVLYDKYYNKITIDDAYEKSIERRVILKPSRGTYGGRGVELWDNNRDKDSFVNYVTNWPDIIAQEAVEQHHELSALHKSSLNTIRIITLTRNGEVIPLSATLRIGVGGNVVDNISSGGILCGVNADGSLKSRGYNYYGKFIERHPQGAIFAEHYIPNYEECLNLVKRGAPRLSNISKLLSWDIAICKDGSPLLVEVNMCLNEPCGHQIANGPLFGDLTEDILSEVFASKRSRFLERFF